MKNDPYAGFEVSQAWKDQELKADRSTTTIHATIPTWVAQVLEPLFTALSDPRFYASEAHGALAVGFSYDDCINPSSASGACRSIGAQSENFPAALHQSGHMLAAVGRLAAGMLDIGIGIGNNFSDEMDTENQLGFRAHAAGVIKEAMNDARNAKAFDPTSNPFDA